MKETHFLSVAVVAVVAVALGGCSAQASQARVAAPGDAEAHQYAAALDEAFDRYEAEVHRATWFPYGSDAEAQAVAKTLTPRRFDALLAASLERRSLSIDDLAGYARHNPQFARSQEQLHAGRLDRIATAAAAIGLVVGDEPMPQSEQLARR